MSLEKYRIFSSDGVTNDNTVLVDWGNEYVCSSKCSKGGVNHYPTFGLFPMYVLPYPGRTTRIAQSLKRLVHGTLDCNSTLPEHMHRKVYKFDSAQEMLDILKREV